MRKVEGKIAYYGLEEWWFSAFSEDERDYIDDRYRPIGELPHSLIRGTHKDLSLHVTGFLYGLNTWFRNREDSSISHRIYQKMSELGREQPIDNPGYYCGRHFSTWVGDLERLKKTGDFSELEDLLFNLVKATEEQSAVDGMGVAPAYYKELAILYHKQKEYAKEISILERFAKQRHAPGVMPKRLLERLEKTRAYLLSHNNS